MTSARQYASDFYLRLRRRCRELIKKGGGIECSAETTRVNQAQMGRYGLAHGADWMPVDVVADLEKDIGEPVVSRALVQAIGYEVIKLPEGRWEGDINQQLAAMFKEVGEVTQHIGQCLADDGCISADEARQHRLRKEIGDAVQVLVGMDKRIMQIEEGE
ncbi:phage regulatory CII family protein [uncultured Cohaesibacter sp.]|uniref:phage regulatory CII family protein n=1 Tax=uncultured Cohaesibacter sp. TaxID=1002546 RepID=UPI0029C97AE1|nr:phage regulatory CII family protein [uncultured Cohaesibacter sp.]